MNGQILIASQRTIHEQLYTFIIIIIQGNLSCYHFREWWRQCVPKLMSPTSSMDYLNPTSHLDEEQLRKYLFNPLDRFLCGCKSESQDITSSSDSDVRDGD